MHDTNTVTGSCGCLTQEKDSKEEVTTFARDEIEAFNVDIFEDYFTNT